MRECWLGSAWGVCGGGEGGGEGGGGGGVMLLEREAVTT